MEEVKEFCENTLAYLIDEGMEINISKKNVEFIQVFAYISGDDKAFNWEEIKDDVLQFLELFDNKFGLSDLSDVDGDLDGDPNYVDVNVSISYVIANQSNNNSPIKYSYSRENYSLENLSSSDYDPTIKVRGINIFTKA